MEGQQQLQQRPSGHNEAASGASSSSSKTESSLFESMRKRVLGDGQSPSSDHGRQFWMPDSRAKTCYDCGATFNALRRRHHCRICGQVFCHRCSPHMMDPKMYKACTGSDTTSSVRVCRYCYRVTLKNELPTSPDHHSQHRSEASSSGKERPAEKGTSSSVTTKDEPSSAGSSLNSWFFNSTFGRRISTSASLASIGDIVRSTITTNNAERKTSFSRPVSASSDSDRRFSLVNSPTDGLGSSSNLASASSYDNLRTIISEVSERIDDDYNKPNWVKEILENVKKKQLDQLEAEQMEEVLEFVDDINTQEPFRFVEEDEDNMSIDHPDSTARVKFNSTAESVSVGYNYQLPNRILTGDRPGSAKPLPLQMDFNGQSFDSSNGSLASETTSPFEVVRKMISGPEKETVEDLQPSLVTPTFEISPDVSFSQVASTEDLAFSLLEAIYDRHCNRILQQALLDEKLSLDWLPVLADLSKRIANSINLAHHSYLSSIDNYYMDSLEMRQGLRRHTVSTLRCGNTFFPMDIRQRVKIKGIQGGNKADCAIVNGVVFTKNVAHRKMRTDISNARLLLFACSIGYDERKRALATTTSTSAILKLTSLDSMRLQEHSYVANLVAKIASSAPDVIFVCGSVSSSALELLHEKYHITVVLNVKRSILDRIALFTGTTVIQSPEILNQTRIGTCGRFRLQKFAISNHAASSNGVALNGGHRLPVSSPMKKTLMFVEGCLPTVGCSVLLRGTPRFAEFRALKSVLGYLVYVQYNARLEKAYHLNLNCIPIDSSLQQSKSAGELLSQLLGSNPRARTRISSSRSRVLTEDTAPLSVVPTDGVSQQIDNGDLSATTTTTTKSPKAAVPKLTEISDNSDPLRSSAAEAAATSTLDGDEDSDGETKTTTTTNNNSSINSTSNKLTTVQLTEIISRNFETLLAALPLSSSPAIDFPVPYLMEANIHGQSSLRHYYPPNLIASERLTVLTTAELDRRRAANEIYENGRHEGDENGFEKDDDYANYVYLRAHYAAIKRDWPALAEAVARKEESKLRPLEARLERRYMLQKPHPLLLNSDYQQHCGRQGANRQLVSDFRACGPYLRCIPSIDGGSHSNQKGVGKEVALAVEPPVEPLSSIDQERLLVLFSVFSPQSKNAPNYCFKPTTLDIAYYGRNDMSLGAFLFRHFFFLRSRFNQTTAVNSVSAAADDGTSFSSSSSVGGIGLSSSSSGSLGSSVSRRIFCSSETCNASMFRHLVRFSHHRGTITVLLSKIQDQQKLVPMPHRVLTWTFCVHCRTKSSNAEMSADALALSFGKFLELKFYGDRHYYYGRYFDPVMPCKHSLHKDAYHFFSYDLLVVSFKYDPIVLYEVVTPAPIIVTTRNQFSKQELINYLQDLTIRGHDVFAKVAEEIERLREAITVKVNAQANGGTTVALPTTFSGLNFESTDLNHVEEWIARLRTEEADFVAAIKESHIAISSSETINSLPVLELFRMQNRVIRTKKAVVEVVAAWNDRLNDFITARKRNPDKLITSLMNRILPDKQQKEQPDTMSNKSFDLDKPESVEQQGTGTISGQTPSSLTSSQENLLEVSPTASRLTSLTSKVISKVASKAANNAGFNEGATENGSTSSFAARFLSGRLAVDEAFFSIGNPFESSFARQYTMFEHFQLPTYKDISIIVRDKDLGSIIAYALTTPEYERKLTDLRPPTASQHFKRLSSVDGILDKSTENYVDGSSMSIPSKAELSDIASSMKSGTVSGAELSQHIDVQYNDAFAKFYCCVYFAEPFRRLRSAVLTDGNASNRETVRRLLPSGEESSLTWAAEELYIHSIANCIPWNAIGGKSGSTFSKTQNQRFILKEVSKGELNHFITFARDYVAYVERALLEKRPSAFVKIIGVYQISYKNSCTNKASVHHILVMENLFYECNISFIYDLKGSMRNRKVEINVAASADTESSIGGEEVGSSSASTSLEVMNNNSRSNVHDEAKLYQNNHAQTSTVLMDENLRLISTVYPLYVHAHSKRLLMEAIFRDSEFLRAHVVMDYSLLVGFDDQYSEYAVGIIDYVRLFNWEKEIEFRVKKLGKTIDPTIVHPSQYQRRFLDAINEYFVDVPDKWAPYMPLVPLAGMRIGSGNGAGGQDETSGASSAELANGAILTDNQGSSTDDVIL